MTFGSARPLMRRNSEGQQEWDDPEPRREGGRSEGVLGSRGAADVPGLVPKRTEDNDHIQVGMYIL